MEFWTSRGTIHAVNGISFDIAPGETLGIVGESGCGKSVTALALMGILPRAGRVTTGSALFGGRDLIQLSDQEMRDIRGREIAMIFQDPMTSLNPVLTIGRQIREAIETHFDMSTKEANQRAAELLDRVGIPSANQRLQRLPAPVLGRHAPARDDRDGPRLQAEAADRGRADDRARRDDPGADPRPAARARRRGERALILITHDLGVVAGMCERVNVMYAGMFMETGRRGSSSPSRAIRTRSGCSSRSRGSTLREAAAPSDRRRAPRHAPPAAACPFQPRCRFEVEASSQEVPPLEEIDRGHKVACFNPVPEDEWQNMRQQVVAP